MRTQLTQAKSVSLYAQMQREVVARHLSDKLLPWLAKRVPVIELGVSGIAAGDATSRNDPQGWALMDKLIQLLTHEDLEVAIAAAWEIGQLGPGYIRSTHATALATLLRDSRNRVRNYAALVFNYLGPAAVNTDVAGQLVRLLEDPFADVRAAAAQALSRVSPDKVQVLMDRLRKDESALVRRSAAQALGNLDPVSERPEVLKLLRRSAKYDPDSTVRIAACDSIDWLNQKQARPLAEVCSLAGEAGCLHGDQAPVVAVQEKPMGPNEDLRVALGELEALVRAGLPLKAPQRPWHLLVAEKIAHLRALQETGAFFSEDQSLLLASLESEYYDRRGHYRKAAATAARGLGLASESPEVWLERKITTGLARPVLKQRLWLFFTYVWSAFYRIGMFTTAAKLLEKAHERMTMARKERPDDPWHGTESCWQYYYAHTWRGQREFDKSEYHFMVSTQHALERLRQKASPEGRFLFERHWASVAGARIQGCGLGWILLQKGRLTDAFRSLLGAQIQLENFGDEFLRLLNDSLLNGTSLRRASPADESHAVAIQRLLGNAEEYCRLDDYGGAMRCWQEVCRASLDAAEFFEDEKAAEAAAQQRATALRQAKEVLARMKSYLEPLEKEDLRWRIRFDLLQARLAMTPIGLHPAIKPPQPGLRENLQTIEAHLNERHNHGDLLVMAGLLHWHFGHFAKAQSNFAEVQEMAAQSDEVLFLEAQLLSAWCAASTIYTIMQAEARHPGGERENHKLVFKLKRDLGAFRDNLSERPASGVENWYLRAMNQRVGGLVLSEGERVRKFVAGPELRFYETALTEELPRGPMRVVEDS